MLVQNDSWWAKLTIKMLLGVTYKLHQYKLKIPDKSVIMIYIPILFRAWKGAMVNVFTSEVLNASGLRRLDYRVQCTPSFEPYGQELRSDSCCAQDHSSQRPKLVKKWHHHINKLNFSFCCSSSPPSSLQCWRSITQRIPTPKNHTWVITSTLLLGGWGNLAQGDDWS